jgi:enoyl-CoA hydratase/carnithine racemase
MTGIMLNVHDKYHAHCCEAQYLRFEAISIEFSDACWARGKTSLARMRSGAKMRPRPGPSLISFQISKRQEFEMADTQEKAGRVYHETHGHVLKIVIDNAAKKNAFSPEMMRELSDAMTLLDRDENLWVGLLCANGDDFTAGLDMPKFFGPKATVKPLPEGNIDPFGLRSRCRKPIVTAVQGIVFTVGIEISLAGDIVIAADNSRFCQMESKRGIAPLGGAHFRYLTRMGWGDAMYHLFLCDEFKADRALKIGLVQEVVPAGTQIERAMEIAQTIAKNAPIGIQITKQAALQFIEVGEKAAIDIIPSIRDRVMNTEDMKEGIQSFVERRQAVFKGR